MHPLSQDNVKLFGILDFVTSLGGRDYTKKARIKNIYGIINALSWRILMPIRAILARYLKVFEVVNP